MSVWPDLSVVKLAPTIETLHLWTQVVGKVRLMLTPWENHGWHVPFYVSPRGLVTGLVPVPGRSFTAEFDLVARQLVLRTSDGGERSVTLAPGSLAAFHDDVVAAVQSLGIEVAIDPMPTEIVGAVRFDRDFEQRGFDADAANAYWRALVEIHRVFQQFRTRFVGKVSPIHLFWGAFDLAITRFSGRDAPPHPGGAPFMNDAIAREAYCHEVSSAGFWPNLGNPEGPCFYSYAYPAPAGIAGITVLPAAARFDAQLGEFLLPYQAVIASGDPDAALLAFLQTTYEAAADLGDWNRAALERVQGSLGRPRKVADGRAPRPRGPTMTRRIDLNDIRLLMQVVEHGSYTAAARAINVPKSTISQRIAALEATVGTGLLRRTSRSFSLTEAGAKLLPHARAIEELARQVEQSLLEQGNELLGTLRISCSNALAQHCLSPIVPKFLAQHDRAVVRVEATNRLVDLVAEGYDMTLRGHVGPLRDSILRQRVVARTPWTIAASPDWLAAHGEILEPEQILPAETLCWSNVTDCPGWSLTRGEEQRKVEVAPRLVSDDMISLKMAAIGGAGLVCLPLYLLKCAFDNGELVRVLPEWQPPLSMISILSPPKGQSSRLASAFSDFLAAELPRIMQG